MKGLHCPDFRFFLLIIDLIKLKKLSKRIKEEDMPMV